MKNPAKPILPGSVVCVTDNNTANKAAVLFEGGNWDKLVTFSLSDLYLV